METPPPPTLEPVFALVIQRLENLDARLDALESRVMKRTAVMCQFLSMLFKTLTDGNETDGSSSVDEEDASMSGGEADTGGNDAHDGDSDG